MAYVGLTGLALADPADADGELLARGHYQRGTTLYEAGELASAMAEFEIARRYHPSAAFDYNIARCLEGLGREREAIAAYQRYVATTLDRQLAGEVTERLAVLEARQRDPQRAPPAHPPAPAHPYLGPGLLAGASLALAASAAGVYGSAAHDYNEAAGSAGCMPCSASVIDGIDRRQNASIGLAVLSGAFAVGDLIWWGIAVRRTGRLREVSSR